MKPRLGVIVRADKTGLGYQTKAYHKWLKPSKTILIDISNLNGNTQYYGWYEDKIIIKGLPNIEQIKQMLADIDVLLTAETPYNLELYRIAKDMGVKTICVENPEFYDHKKYPQYALPDMIILPSTWLEADIRQHAEPLGVKVVQLHHPVDRQEITYRPRFTNKTLHIAGKPATQDRNGTWDYLRAVPNGKVITQDENFANHLRSRFRHSNIYTDIADNNLMYSYGDIMVLPRKYGGNCLPLNEALASGMPVIMPDITPNNNLLPKEWLVPATFDGMLNVRGDNISMFRTEAPILSQKVKELQSLDITVLSRLANDIADTIRWEVMLPKYQNAVESLFYG